MSTITKEQAQKIIEASDEVITALAGTNEDVHPESDSMLRLWDDLNDRYAPPEVVRELARIALASLEAEAVGTFRKGPCGYSPSFHEDAVPLYTAPPAPANAEPVAWLWSHRKHPREVALVRPEDDEKAEAALWSGWSCQALYAEVPASTPMKDHQIRELVNELRNIAVEYHGTQQLRERIARTVRAAMLQGAEPVTTDYKLPEETGSSLQLRNLIRQRHAEWSQATFGDVGPVGPLKHLSKEALEAAEEPEDLSEWADMQFLLWDAQRRAGISDGEITAAMEEKLKVNMARQWPEPKDGEPRLHIKENGNSPVILDGWIACSERMPEDDDFVYIWPRPDFGVELHVGQYCECHPKGDGWYAQVYEQNYGIEWCPITVTHWMPMPAVPQQEVK